MSSQTETTPKPETEDQKATNQGAAEEAVAASPATDETASDAGEEATAEVSPPESESAAAEATAEATEPPTGETEVVTEATEPVEATSEAEASTEEASAVEASTEEAASVEAAAEEAAPVEASTEEAASVEATAEEVAPVEATAEEAAPVEASAEEAAPVEATTEEASAVEASSTEDAASASKEDAAPAEAAAVETAADGEKGAASTEGAADANANDTVSGLTPLEASVDDEPGDTMALLERAMKEKRAVKGQVIGWNKGGYHVAIGKIAAFCPVSQIEIGNPRSPKRYLDKSFQFRVIEIQNGGRRVVISRSEALKAEREARAALVRDRLKPGTKLEGRVSSLTNFGAFIDLGGGIEGLVHVSELSRQRVEHPKEMLKVGDEVKVSVLKIEKGGERISLSMKRLEADPWKKIADRLPVGSQFVGKVLRKTEFGIFVQLEAGIEGLVHLSRLPLGITMEDESLEIGKEVQGWVHEVDGRRRRLSLSLREVASSNPWKGIHERFPVGEVVTGTVERLANFGVFIELEPGLTGLLPFSTLPGGRVSNPRRQYFPGKEVQVRVLSIDSDKRRISLGTEASKAEGSQQDYREYVKAQNTGGAGLSAMAAAFAKLQEQQQ